MRRILAVIVMAGSLGFLAGCGESAAEKSAREAKEAAENQAVMKANDEEQKTVKAENDKVRAGDAGKTEEAADDEKPGDENGKEDAATGKSEDASAKAKEE